MFSDLPLDVFIVLCSFFSFDELNRMKDICKQFYEGIRKYLNFRYSKNYLQGIYKNSFLSQSYIIERLLELDDRKMISINSPVGSGKTSIGLWYAKKYKDEGFSVVIFYTSKTFTSWLDEVKKWNFYDLDPEKSKVNFRNKTNNKNHSSYKDYKNKIVLQSSQITCQIDFDVVIFDEAHLLTNKKLYCFTKNAKKILFLSASKISLNKSKDYSRYYTSQEISQIYIDNNIQQKFIGEIVPLTIECFFGTLEQISYKSLDLNFTKNDSCGGKYANFIYKFFYTKNIHEDLFLLAQKYKKIVVLVSDSKIELEKIIKDIKINTHSLVPYKNNRKTIMKKFREEDTIIFCTYKTASEGINFSEADCMVCYDFGNNSIEKSMQSLGRVKRLNNTQKNILIMFSIEKCESIEDYKKFINTKLNYFYATSKTSFFVKKTDIIKKVVIKTLLEVGINPIKLNLQEMLILFTHGNHSFENFKSKIPLDLLLTLSHN